MDQKNKFFWRFIIVAVYVTLETDTAMFVDVTTVNLLLN
jgi:hypothetical protein